MSAVPHCAICAAQSETAQAQDLANGEYCPVCYKPTCRRHLVTVRFRWRENAVLDSALVCRDCKTQYQHRYWDTARRDWIS